MLKGNSYWLFISHFSFVSVTKKDGLLTVISSQNVGQLPVTLFACCSVTSHTHLYGSSRLT